MNVYIRSYIFHPHTVYGKKLFSGEMVLIEYYANRVANDGIRDNCITFIPVIPLISGR